MTNEKKYLNARIGLRKGKIEFFVSDGEDKSDFSISLVRSKISTVKIRKFRDGDSEYEFSIEAIDKLEGYEDEVHKIRFYVDKDKNHIIDLFNSRCEYGHRCHIKEEDCRTFLEGLMLVMNYAIVYCWCECEVEEIPYDGFRQID